MFRMDKWALRFRALRVHVPNNRVLGGLVQVIAVQGLGNYMIVVPAPFRQLGPNPDPKS